MRKSKRRSGPGFFGRVLIFLCVAAAFAALWAGAELVAKRLNGASQQDASGGTETAAGLPKNSYDLTCFSSQDGFIRYTGAQASQTGVDVSAHQGDIDWAAVAAKGVTYAMIRVGYRGYTDGTISLDEKFQSNVKNALANGLKVGVYFFSQAITTDEAAEEAKTALGAIKGLDVTYPVVFDWESIEGGGRTDSVDQTTLTKCAETFCGAVKAAGYTPGVYFNQNIGYQEYDLPALQDYVFWLAQYADAPDFYYDFQMWQYSKSGKVDGIDGDVDLNLSFWQPAAAK